MNFELVEFDKQYAEQIGPLYHLAVHSYVGEFYTRAQLNAWSAAPRSSYHWRKRLSQTRSWLAIVAGRCVGFINMETHFHSRGYIDSLYVLPQYQHQGIATALIVQAQQWAIEQGYRQLTVDASAMSKPVFIRQGFKLHHRRYQQKNGEVIAGFALYKNLT